MQSTNGIAHKNGSSDDVSVWVRFAYDGTAADTENLLVIASKTHDDLEFHPATGFFNEEVTLSLRTDGITTSYSGITDSASGNFNTVAIFVFDSELLKKIQGPGQWDVLIEGKSGWYIRAKINGNLPQE